MSVAAIGSPDLARSLQRAGSRRRWTAIALTLPLLVFLLVTLLIPIGALLVRAFADDLVALFEEPGQALDAAFEVHRRITVFNESEHASEKPALACIGVGYGDVYAIGPNLAMGDEMNRSSKLGEDTARGNETLITSNVYAALRHRSDILFEQLASDDQLFSYYRASPH